MSDKKKVNREAAAASRWTIRGSLVALLCATASTVWAEEPGPTMWRFEWDNDVVFQSDNQFTNGTSIQKNGPVVANWAEAAGTPAFGKAMAAKFLPVKRAGLRFRESWRVGQNLQTPADQSRKDLITDDVPYAALLAVENTWIAYDDRRLYTFGWLLGVVGPAALGKPVQKGFHALVHSDDPQGWSNQLHNEPALNLYCEWKRKVARAAWADVAIGGGANVGNVFTGARATLEARIGRNLPDGFVHLPDPLGFGLSHAADDGSRARGGWSVYASVAVRSTAVAYSIFYDGNLLRDGPSVPHRTMVNATLVGLHLERPRWGVHLHVLRSTDMVSPQVARSEPDTTIDYGTITLDFRR